MPINSEFKDKVFEQFRVSMGAPYRKVELDDDQLCVLLDIAIEDYSQRRYNRHGICIKR
jgi:hypothetical protein